MQEDKMQILKTTIEDAKEIFDLQKKAFHQQAVYYNNFQLKPLIETFDEYEKSFSAFTFLKAIEHNRIVGSVRANMSDTSCHIGRLIVDPEYQKNGIGSKLMLEIERLFKNSANRYELFTGEQSFRSLSLYRNLGYRVFKRTDDYDVPIVFMEKRCIKDADITILQADVQNKSHNDAIKILVKEYFEWGNSISIEKHGFNFDIDQMFIDFMGDLSKYSYPNGILFLIKHNDDYVGLGGFKEFSENACELKRMYLQEYFRGNGLGKRLLTAIVDKAEEYGYQEMRLESARFMRNGYNLYKSFGFSETSIYQRVESPVEYQAIIYCMKKELNPKATRPLRTDSPHNRAELNSSVSNISENVPS